MKKTKIYMALSSFMLIAGAGCQKANDDQFPKFLEDYQEDTFLIRDLPFQLGVGDTYSLDVMFPEALDISYICQNKKICQVNDDNELVALKEGTTKLYAYIPESKYMQTFTVNVLSSEEIQSNFKIEKGSFAGKTITFIGDSITQYWGDDNYYVKFLADDLGANYYNLGISGSTAAYSEVRAKLQGNNVVDIGPNFVDRGIADGKMGDYAFILYGTNDWSGCVPLGNIDEHPAKTADCLTFYGGMNYMISSIKEKSPKTKIILMNLLNRNRVYDSNPGNIGEIHEFEEFNEAIYNIAVAQNVKFIDLFSLFSDDNLMLYTKDGLHPNATGHRLIADYILKQ